MPIRILGFFFLQMTAIGKQDLTEITGRARAVDSAFETVLGEQRQVTAVIDMSMGEDYCLDRPGIDGQRFPVSQAQLLEALEQPAINKELFGTAAQEVFRSRYRSRRAKKLDFHIQTPQL